MLTISLKGRHLGRRHLSPACVSSLGPDHLNLWHDVCCACCSCDGTLGAGPLTSSSHGTIAHGASRSTPSKRGCGSAWGDRRSPAYSCCCLVVKQGVATGTGSYMLPYASCHARVMLDARLTTKPNLSAPPKQELAVRDAPEIVLIQLCRCLLQLCRVQLDSQRIHQRLQLQGADEPGPLHV